MSTLDVVILAAGRGTRMKSQRPKVLHTIGGQSMLQHVVGTARALAPRRIVIVTGFGSDAVRAAAIGDDIAFAAQEPQIGTGHAVQQAVPLLGDDGTTLILNGDVPLIRAETAQRLVQASDGQQLALLTIDLVNPTGYGRILRDALDNTVTGIIEEKDATDSQRAIHETYTGMMAAPTAHLKRWLASLTNDNAQHEYYLTDIVAMAVTDHVPVVGLSTSDSVQVAGVNSPAQLAALERAWQGQVAQALMADGVRLADPGRIDVRGTLTCGTDVEIDVNCVFSGNVTLGNDVHIGANCVIANARIAAGAVVHPFTHIDGEAKGVKVGEGALIGPFSRLRPGADIGTEVHIGNFVEVKNSIVAAGAKANHLAYVGDATVGERVNIGAGSITANYDGVAKHHTTIGAETRVGSNCVLVAPVTLGERSTIGAGSVITKDVPADTLAVARGRQAAIAGWKRPEKN